MLHWDGEKEFMSAGYSGFARRLFRRYRNGPITVGHSFLRRALGSRLAEIQQARLRSGLRLQLDLTKANQNTIFWQDGDIEVQLYWAIRELLPLGGTFVDCGANCGLMGLLARQYRQARVLFFEPHPRLAATIATNIQLNGFGETCELAQCALSDRNGEVDFYEHPRQDGSHSLHKDWTGGMRELGKVKCVRLADILPQRNVSKIHFLKVDTEGNDLAVLRGASDWLKPERIELIYVEMSREREVMCQLLESQGYVGFVTASKNRREMARRQREYERGGKASFFLPRTRESAGIVPWNEIEGETLWCGKNSPTASYLFEQQRPDGIAN